MVKQTKELCIWHMSYNRCCHPSAPKPYHCRCIGLRLCEVFRPKTLSNDKRKNKE